MGSVGWLNLRHLRSSVDVDNPDLRLGLANAPSGRSLDKLEWPLRLPVIRREEGAGTRLVTLPVPSFAWDVIEGVKHADDVAKIDMCAIAKGEERARAGGPYARRRLDTRQPRLTSKSAFARRDIPRDRMPNQTRPIACPSF